MSDLMILKISFLWDHCLQSSHLKRFSPEKTFCEKIFPMMGKSSRRMSSLQYTFSSCEPSNNSSSWCWFPKMSDLMILKISFLCKSCPTYLTLKWFLSREDILREDFPNDGKIFLQNVFSQVLCLQVMSLIIIQHLGVDFPKYLSWWFFRFPFLCKICCTSSHLKVYLQHVHLLSYVALCPH